MAPEQALGNNRAIDHRADQFSLAAIAYELLTGQAAFNGDAVEAVLYQVVHEAPPPLAMFRRDIPAHLERALLRALAKVPEGRFPSIGAFGQALFIAAQATPVGRPTVATVPRSRRGGTDVPAGPTPLRPDEPAGITTFGSATAERSTDRIVRMRQRRRSTAGTIVSLAAAAVGTLVWIAWRQKPRSPAIDTQPTWPSVNSARESPVPAPVPAPEFAPPPGPEAPTAPVEGSPVRIANPPANLRLLVDGLPVELPVLLARKPGQYQLRFESPGRRAQTIVVDAMAPVHELRLRMPRLRAKTSAPPLPEELPEDSEAAAPEELPAPLPELPAPQPETPAPQPETPAAQPEPPAPQAEPPPAQAGPAPANPPPEAPPPESTPPAVPAPKENPALIEDVDDAPAPVQPAPPEPAPLIDDL